MAHMHASCIMERAVKRALRRDSSGAASTVVETGHLLLTRIERGLPCERGRTKYGSTRRQGAPVGHQRAVRDSLLSHLVAQPFIEKERHQPSLVTSNGHRCGSAVQEELSWRIVFVLVSICKH